MQSYPMSLRMRVLEACDAGQQTKQVAAVFCVSTAWVRRLKQRRRENGSIEPRPNPGCRPKLNEFARARLSQFVRERPDTTLNELRARIGHELNIRISIGALWETLQKMQLSLKNSRLPRARREEPVGLANGVQYHLLNEVLNSPAAPAETAYG